MSRLLRINDLYIQEDGTLGASPSDIPWDPTNHAWSAVGPMQISVGGYLTTTARRDVVLSWDESVDARTYSAILRCFFGLGVDFFRVDSLWLPEQGSSDLLVYNQHTGLFGQKIVAMPPEEFRPDGVNVTGLTWRFRNVAPVTSAH